MTDVVPNFEWLGPTVTAIGAVIVAAIGGASVIWRRRQDARDKSEEQAAAKIHTEKDGWEEIREAHSEATRYYKLYRTFEDLFYSVHSALRHLARTHHEAHPERELPQNVIDALSLRPPEDTDN